VRFVLATRNLHKLRELEALLEPHRLEALPADVRLPPETGTTFAENALGKAVAAAEATGVPALAALDDRPGIHSARYAGQYATDEENLAKLLRELEGESDRRAAYVCALALVEPGGERKVFEGRCEGSLIDRPRGSGGFGYDPIFVAEGWDRTMAELADEEKDRISHRGRAFRALGATLATG
jgi:XTP/dITP diphosphohydrolase